MSLVRPPIRFQEQGNPYFPLPPDYPDLRGDGPRLARVNACRLLDSHRDAVQSWAFFRKTYLWPDPDASFDPGFYKPPYLPSPPLHYNLVRWLHQFDCCCIGAPRGSAKSTTKRSIMLWKLLCFPGQEINSFLAKDDFVLEEAFRMKTQLDYNERILADFGDQKPSRGSGIWTGHTCTLENRSILRLFSIAGLKRGPRADLNIFDDIEGDESMSRAKESVETLKENVLKVVLPMMGSHGRMLLLGTLINRGSFLNYVLTSDDEQFRSVDDGGDWYKRIVAAIDADGHCAWPELYTPEFLEKRRRMMGEAKFQTEYMNNPMPEDEAPFVIRARDHEYLLPEYRGDTPLATTGDVVYHEAHAGPDGLEHKEIRQPFSEWIGPLQRILTVDAASSLLQSADFSAVSVGGLDSRNCMWLLDGWFDRVLPAALSAKVFSMAQRWRVAIIAVEAFGTQMDIYRTIAEYVAAHPDNDWRPTVLPLKPAQRYSKEDRIMGLQWRFPQGRIKLPAHLRLSKWGMELYQQITNFTPDGRGLMHDDIIDSVAAMQFVWRGASKAVPIHSTPQTPLDRMLAGELYYDGTRIPLSSAVDWKALPLSTVEQLVAVLQQHRNTEDIATTDAGEPGIQVGLPPEHGGLL